MIEVYILGLEDAGLNLGVMKYLQKLFQVYLYPMELLCSCAPG